MTSGVSREELERRLKEFEKESTMRRQAEEALRESEERYRIAVERSSDGVAIVMGDSHIYANEKFAQIFGYDRPDEIVGKSLSVLVHPDDRERVSRFNHSRQEGGSAPSRYECKGLRKDGSLVYLSVSAASTTYRGKPVSLVFMRDVTERKLVQETLSQSEARYRSIFENIQDVYYEVTLEGTILEVSPSIEKMSGYRREEVLGRSLYDIYDNPKEREGLIKELLGKGKVTDYEIILKDKNGSKGCCSITALLARDRDGHPEKIIGSLRNITERRKAEAALQESEAQKRAILEASIDRICYLDRDMKIIWVNRVAAVGLGKSTDDLKGRACYEGLIGRDKPCEGCAIVKAMETGRIERALMHVAKMNGIDGESYWDTYCVPMRDNAGEITNYLQVARNVTELTRAMDAQHKSEETLRAILAASSAGIVMSADRTIGWSNRAFYSLLGYEEDSLLGKNARVLYPDDREYERVGRELSSAVEEEGIGRVETRWVRKDGGVVQCYLQASPLDPSEPNKGLIVTSTDITELKRTEGRIHRLSQELMRAQEYERQRISRELHDRVGQDLSIVKVGFDTLFDNHPEILPGISQKISGYSKMLQKCIMVVRDLSYDLRPPTLDELGLGQTLSRYCEDFSEKTGLRVDFAAAGVDQLALNSNAEINLYRLIQEGLNNIRKHADAGQVTIRFVVSHPKLLLRIEDDGKGFDVNSYLSSRTDEKRMGIQSMEERVNLLGGRMDIRSRLGKGTRILIDIPYEENQGDSKERDIDR
ncbi:MAG: PAS domain-containing sensor histidine kinase [Desulfobacteraceae bacterium]|jgi:PAS domain S-box-containing protein|nr:MAG: PAS domain-containing sensor histidine kinase [Desulfobacteraceae bacterium]